MKHLKIVKDHPHGQEKITSKGDDRDFSKSDNGSEVEN
jgi:hypothetical protein